MSILGDFRDVVYIAFLALQIFLLLCVLHLYVLIVRPLYRLERRLRGNHD